MSSKHTYTPQISGFPTLHPHLRNHPRHITANTVIIKQTLNIANRRDSNITIPELPLSKVHDVLLGDGTHDALYLLRAVTTASGDDLATNVLGDGGGAIEGEEKRGLELGLCALDFGRCDVGGETGPFAESEVDEIVEASWVSGSEVDAPETGRMLAYLFQSN